MKDAILLELATRWEREANPRGGMAVVETDIEQGYSEGVADGKIAGEREQLRACADTLRELVRMLGDSQS